MLDEKRQRILVREIRRMQEKKNQLEEQINEYKAELRELPVGKHDTGVGVIEIQANRRFDEGFFQETYPQLYPLCLSSQLDLDKAKENLPGAIYQDCMREVGVGKKVIIR